MIRSRGGGGGGGGGVKPNGGIMYNMQVSV